jgi:CRISPR-associated protein Csb2
LPAGETFDIVPAVISHVVDDALAEPLSSARLWRWRLTGDPIPVEATVDVAHAIYAALNATAADVFGTSSLPPDLHPDPRRSGARGRQEHTHAFVLPEDLNGDGYLDHCAVACPEALGGKGLSRRGLILLAACRRFWIAGLADVKLEPEFLGAACPRGTDRPARQWRSQTPFLPPVHRTDPDVQILNTLRVLGLPTPAAIDRIAPSARLAGSDGRIVLPRDFAPRAVASRRWRALALPDSSLAFWRIVFKEPVTGPVLLGQLSHFGLGRFTPAD